MLDVNDTLASCADCGMSFVIKQGEKDWFLERGFMLPKRCKSCREKRKAQNTNNYHYPVVNR